MERQIKQTIHLNSSRRKKPDRQSNHKDIKNDSQPVKSQIKHGEDRGVHPRKTLLHIANEGKNWIQSPTPSTKRATKTFDKVQSKQIMLWPCSLANLQPSHSSVASATRAFSAWKATHLAPRNLPSKLWIIMPTTAQQLLFFQAASTFFFFDKKLRKGCPRSLGRGMNESHGGRGGKLL